MKTFLFLVSVSVLFWGCASPQQDDSDAIQSENVIQEKQLVPATKKATIKDRANAESPGISLNNGEKWFVDREMLPYIIEAQDAVFEYADENLNDYAFLGRRLSNYNADLISKCTMKGEAHDELHNWLHPHMQLIDALQNAKSQEEANVIIAELKTSFLTFHEYFE